jgi:hypothetical protein
MRDDAMIAVVMTVDVAWNFCRHGDALLGFFDEVLVVVARS